MEDRNTEITSRLYDLPSGGESPTAADENCSHADDLRLKLRNWRERNGLSQARIANMLGIKQSTLSSFELGKNRVLRSETARKLNQLLVFNNIYSFTPEADGPKSMEAHSSEKKESVRGRNEFLIPDQYQFVRSPKASRLFELQRAGALPDELTAERISDADIAYYYSVYILNRGSSYTDMILSLLVKLGICNRDDSLPFTRPESFLTYCEISRLGNIPPIELRLTLKKRLEAIGAITRWDELPTMNLICMHCVELRDRGSLYWEFCSL